MSVKQKTRRMKNKTTKTLLKHTMAESSNNKYFFSLFTIIGICLEFWSCFLRKLLSYYASFFSYKLIWDFKEPLKIVEVIPNFAKRFSGNSKFNILLLWGIVIFFISSQIWIFQNKVGFCGSFWGFFPTKSFEESFENHISKLAKKN